MVLQTFCHTAAYPKPADMEVTTYPSKILDGEKRIYSTTRRWSYPQLVKQIMLTGYGWNGWR